MARWPALPERWWKEKWAKAVTPGKSLDLPFLRKPPPTQSHTLHLIPESPLADVGDGGSISLFCKNRLLLYHVKLLFVIYDQKAVNLKAKTECFSVNPLYYGWIVYLLWINDRLQPTIWCDVKMCFYFSHIMSLHIILRETNKINVQMRSC